MSSEVFLTIITPTYNEVESIGNCISSVRETLQNYSEVLVYEHLIIDNNSKDSTAEVVAEAASTDHRVRLIVNSRNIGVERSIFRALGKVNGKWVVPMLPADMQDPVGAIPQFLELIKDEETEVVYGIRTNRQESFLMRSLRTMYYRIIRKFSNTEIHLNAGEFALVSKEIVDSIIETNDQYPYVRGLISQTGAKFKTLEYSWEIRKSGKSKASPLVLIDVAINGFVSTSHIPARIALILGFVLSTMGIFAGASYLVATLFFSAVIGTGIPTLVISLFFFSGIQLFFIGLIGEYVLSIHRQVKLEPTVRSSKEINS
jgi:glycosyltransferase involved in cell wall biosynthesis